MLPVDQTKKVIADLQSMAIVAIDIFQKGTGTTIMQDLKALHEKAKQLVLDEKGVWPELKDLDEAEASELGKVSFQAITAVVHKLKRK